LSGDDNPAYMPFGLGARSCIGSHLAMLEVVILTSVFIKELELFVNDKIPVRLDPGLTLRPAEAIPVELKIR